MSQIQQTARVGGSGVADVLSDLSPQSNVLVCGPSMVGKRGLAFDLLSALSSAELPAVLSTSVTANVVRQRVSDVVDERGCYVVDTVSQQVSSGFFATETDDTWYVSAPSDLTGLGVSTSKAVGHIAAANARPRLVMDNLSTLLLYNSLERVYRFLHVLNGRIAQLDGITVHVIHTDASDAREFETISQLFDVVCRVEESEETPTTTIRTRDATAPSAPLADVRAQLTESG